MMKEAMAPPLPPKTRSNSCCAVGGSAGATVFIRPGVQVHSSRDSASNTYPVNALANADLGAGVGPTGGHVVKIKINPENGESNDSATHKSSISSVQLNCNTESSDTETSLVSSPATSVVRISVGDSQPADEMRGTDRTSAYFFCNGSISAVMSSGQCSPSDTLDSGTCSDLDGTPPPLPKKKSVTVTVIGAQHKRASSLTSSGADPDSAGSDNESNISCDSLNSSDLNYTAVPPSPPSMVGLKHTTAKSTSSAFLPQGLLKDIRDRSAKLTQPNVDSPVDEVDNTNEVNNSTIEIIEEPRPVVKSCVLISESTYEERQEQQKKASLNRTSEQPTRVYTYETDKYYKFHLNEHVTDDDNKAPVVKPSEDDESFAGYRDYLGGNGSSTIRSAKGTVRGVKNRVRAGIATFLQINTTSKSYREKDAGKVVVYSTTMGIVRHTYQQCVKVKQILRTHLVKFEERDVFMSAECQQEIRERMRCDHILVPQVFVDGQHVGDAETVERLNESGELRKILKPYKSADACTTCTACGGFRLLPCQVCNGSKKSVHRNHFTTEFVALKCMNCDEVGLVRCSTCS